MPIIFYGKLVDQFGDPVKGASINASVRIYNGYKSTVDRFSVVSDTNGAFRIDHGKGEALGLVPAKEGYVLATKDTSFKYSYMFPDRFSPDSNNPTLIKMWKLQDAEPLAATDKEFRLLLSDQPIYFDLLAGCFIENGGDLKIVITRANGSLSKRTPGDWSIELEPVDGGIIESDYHTARATFEAPTNGYHKSYLVQMNHEDRAWFDSIQKVFFVKSRNGQIYSKVSLDFGINRDPESAMYFHFKVIANTNGSRNWEEPRDR